MERERRVAYYVLRRYRPKLLTICGSFFMLRAIESLLAFAKSVNVSRLLKKATWLLPATKSDPRALGKDRYWGCICEHKLRTCPQCSAEGQEDRALGPFAQDGVLPDDSQFLPSESGAAATKEGVAATLEPLQQLSGHDMSTRTATTSSADTACE